MVERITAPFYISVASGQPGRVTSKPIPSESQTHGWLPATLPRSATEIHEWHDFDTNMCFGSFRFDPTERSAIEVTLRPGRPRTIRIDRDPSFASPLPRDPGEEHLLSAGYEFYSEPDFAFAISWKAGIAYFWNSSS